MTKKTSGKTEEEVIVEEERSLHFYVVPSILFGMPKGGLDMRVSLVFTIVLFVLEAAINCSLRVVFYR